MDNTINEYRELRRHQNPGQVAEIEAMDLDELYAIVTYFAEIAGRDEDYYQQCVRFRPSYAKGPTTSERGAQAVARKTAGLVRLIEIIIERKSR